MPIQYARGIVAEHRTVREAAGLIAESHLGQIWVTGPEAEATLERLLTCRVETLRPGRVRYGLLCHEHGGTVDDVTLYRLGPDRFFLCVNAANIEKDYRWVVRHAGGARIEDRSDRTALLALQGPASLDVIARLWDHTGRPPGRFRFVEAKVAGVPVLASRTGYTGSDGFEIYLPSDGAETLFDAILDAGRSAGVEPAGLGARDTLRLEAALPLYGHELEDDVSPIEAGLERFVKLDRGGFLGCEALRAQAAAPLARRLAGFALTDRGIARAGHEIFAADQAVGVVSSGAPSPTLGRSIGLGFVAPPLAEPGTPLKVQVRGRMLAARVVDTPFVKPDR